jgi:hypothetical protein
VDLAGVGEDDFELQLFEDALVVEGRRQLPSCDDEAVYQSAGIRQGPFRLEVPLSAPVDAQRVAARADHGLAAHHAAQARGGPLMAAEAGAGPADFVIPDTLPVLPLRDAVVLPLTAVPLTVGRPRSVQLVDDVMRGNRLLALVAERNTVSDPGPEDLHRVGTVGAIHQLHRVPDGTVRLMVQGIERIRLVDFTGTDPYLVARVEVLKDQTDQATEVDALRRAVVDVFRRLVEASAGDARRDGDGRGESLRSSSRGLLRRCGRADRRGGPPGAARARPRLGQAPPVG